MLLIAMPKSASTSLVKTLGRLHGVGAEQEEPRISTVPGRFGILGQIHFDVRDFTPGHIERYCAPSGFHKQHIPPTQANQTLLAHRKKVVLVRSSLEIVASYRRAVLAGEEGYASILRDVLFAGCRAEGEWIDRAAALGLIDELDKFRSGWTEHAGSRLLVEYSRIIREPAAVINEIEAYFELPASKQVALSKHRYTRSLARNTVRRLLKPLGVYPYFRDAYRALAHRLGYSTDVTDGT